MTTRRTPSPVPRRCDIFVPPTYWERIRFYFGEAVLAVLLLTKSLVASDPYRWVQPLGTSSADRTHECCKGPRCRQRCIGSCMC
jgi:hypothetical protein